MRKPLHCDCHDPQDPRSAKLAERDENRVIIRDRQFGQTHTLVIDLEKEAEKLKRPT